jgi:hypothetical protein
LVGLRSKRDLLMFNGQQLRRVVNRAIAIIVVADSAVEKMIAEDAIERSYLGGRRLCGLGGDLHSIGDRGRAGSDQAAVHFDHACVTRLNRAELRVVADMRDRPAYTVDHIDEKLVGSGFLNAAVNRNIDHSFLLPATRKMCGFSRSSSNQPVHPDHICLRPHSAHLGKQVTPHEQKETISISHPRFGITEAEPQTSSAFLMPTPEAKLMFDFNRDLH